MSRRAVSVLQVADTAAWDELASLGLSEAHVAEVLDDHRRVVRPAFERELLPSLTGRVLVRYPRRRSTPSMVDGSPHPDDAVPDLRADVRAVLHSAQRHAIDEMVSGRQAWDPEHDAASVRALVQAGMLQPLADDDGAGPYQGRYRLAPDLPPPPDIPYALSEAVMEETDDLSAPREAPLRLLHDVASLAAAIEHIQPRLTHAGTVAKADVRKLATRLADRGLAESGALEGDPRWGQALRALQALGVVALDPITRRWSLDLGLERTLAGETEQAFDRFVHRLVDRDLHVVVPAVRAALAQAGQGALDELIFLELLREQHRDILFPAWVRDGQRVYPDFGQDGHLPWIDEAWERVEAPLVAKVLSRLARIGVLRTAPGVFAGTDDGRRWAGAVTVHRPPVWISGDLELIVPPDSVTPWERFQLERLGRCLQRDTVDRYRLEREALATWLSTHDVDEALALLRRRSPGVPRTVVETLTTWAASAQRIVLWRGIVLDD